MNTTERTDAEEFFDPAGNGLVESQFARALEVELAAKEREAEGLKGELKAYMEGIREARNHSQDIQQHYQEYVTEAFAFLDQFAEALGIDTGEEAWWDISEEEKYKVILRKVQTQAPVADGDWAERAMEQILKNQFDNLYGTTGPEPFKWAIKAGAEIIRAALPPQMPTLDAELNLCPSLNSQSKISEFNDAWRPIETAPREENQ